jgi:outer membrane protein insertion porin family/translocation and assembly module TamA
LYPTRLPDLQRPTALLPEGRVQADLRNPGFLESRTSALLRAEASVFPLLVATQTEPGEPVVGYRELRGTAGLERSVWKFFAFPSYDVQMNDPFTYQGALDPALQRVVISYVELLANLDLRDDKVHPRKGLYLGADLQFAGLGGDARDFRVNPEARLYAPVTRRVTFALRGSLGLLFPQNYGSFIGSPTVPPDADRTAWARDVQIGYFRGFYSGGPSSNRGYPFRGIGPHGLVPFFSPGIAAQQLALSCDPHSPSFDPVRCAIPLGGRTLWEASAEMRVALSGPLGGALFCDASDVSPSEVDFRFNHPHLSCGFGARYDTPVGPIRLDVGYRIPGLQTLVNVNPIEEGSPGTIFGIPVAVAFGIGEAF